MKEGCFVKTMRWTSETARRHALAKPRTASAEPWWFMMERRLTVTEYCLTMTTTWQGTTKHRLSVTRREEGQIV
jgi:hypothetical protein